MDATDVNTPNNEVVAIQTELGTVPKGTFATVKDRLNAAGAVVLGPFAERNVPASLAAADIGLLNDADFTQAVAFRAGSIIGIAIRSNAARTAGTPTAEVFKNGVATGLMAVLNATNTQTKVARNRTAGGGAVSGPRSYLLVMPSSISSSRDRSSALMSTISPRTASSAMIGTAIATSRANASVVIGPAPARRTGVGRVHQDARCDKASNGRQQQREQDDGRDHDSELHVRIFVPPNGGP
jgi:hypothetical protein